MTVTGYLYGTGDAPLLATRSYTFTRGGPQVGKPSLSVSVAYRNSQDDFGSVEYSEQEVFVERLCRSLGVASSGGYPGEWIFADTDTQELVWMALEETIGTPAKSPPRATASREVSQAEAAAVSDALTARFLALVGAVLGLDQPFRCLERRIDNNSHDAARNEVWQVDGATVRIDAIGIQSAHGVHGESCDYTMTGRPGDPRTVAMHARIDMRSGGTYSVTVQGVRDAQALVDAFVAAPATAARP